MGQYSKDNVTWKDTYLYAQELIDDNIFEKEELLGNLANRSPNNPNKAFEWLADLAIKKHTEKLEDEVLNQEIITDEESDFIFEEISQEIINSKILKKRIIGATALSLSSLSILVYRIIDENNGRNNYPLHLTSLGLIAVSAYMVHKMKNS